jgi:hypothetical protein
MQLVVVYLGVLMADDGETSKEEQIANYASLLVIVGKS